MYTYFPIGLAKAVIVALEVVMVRKTNDNIDTASRIKNELHAKVFVAITMRRSMRRRSMFGSVFGSVPAA